MNKHNQKQTNILGNYDIFEFLNFAFFNFNSGFFESNISGFTL